MMSEDGREYRKKQTRSTMDGSVSLKRILYIYYNEETQFAISFNRVSIRLISIAINTSWLSANV